MNNFLLTYVEDNKTNYAWFETEEELLDFTEVNSHIQIEEALELTVVREITIE